MHWTDGQKNAIEGLKEWFKKGNSQTATLLGYAGCVDPDQLIHTDKGLVSMRNLIKESTGGDLSIRGFEDYNGDRMVSDGKGNWNQITRVYGTDYMEGYEIKLKSGRTLRVSNIHPFLVLNPETMKYDWMTAEDIKTGQEIALSEGLGETVRYSKKIKSKYDEIPGFNELYPSTIVIDDRISYMRKVKSLMLDNMEATEIESLLLGMLVGTLTKSVHRQFKMKYSYLSYMIIQLIKEVRDRRLKKKSSKGFLLDFFNINSYEEISDKYLDGLIGDYNETTLENLEYSIQLIDEKSNDRIKEVLLDEFKYQISSSSKRKQYWIAQGIMNGLQAKGNQDGTIIVYIQVNAGLEFAENIMYLLDYFGMKSGIVKLYNGYHLTFSSENLREIEVWKMFYLNNYFEKSLYSLLRTQKYTNRMRNPRFGGHLEMFKPNKFIVDTIYEAMKDKKIGKNRLSLLETNNISRNEVKRLIIDNYRELLDLEFIFEESYLWDTVEEITPIHQRFFDITVPNGHVYEANGVINHNTGKSTVVSHLIEDLGLLESEVLTVTYTGKAAFRLMLEGVNATTIHSVLYDPYEEVTYYSKKTGKAVASSMVMDDSEDPMNVVDRGKDSKKYSMDDVKVVRRMKWKRKSEAPSGIKLIIIDEVSMVTKKIYNDLLMFGVPIINIGDNFQIPPVGGQQIDDMQNPDFFLDEVVRQAENSAIIQLSMMARNSQDIPIGQYRDKRTNKLSAVVLEPGSHEYVDLTQPSQVICGRNSTRHKLNEIIRYDLLGTTNPLPVKGDKLICLRNNRNVVTATGFPMTNGMIGHVMEDVVFVDTYKGAFKVAFAEIYGSELPGSLEGLDDRTTFIDSSLTDFLVNSQVIQPGRDTTDGELKKFIRDNKSEIGIQDQTSRPKGHSDKLSIFTQYGNLLPFTDGADGVKNEYNNNKDLILFDYGYAITNHKAQGSQFPSVYGIEERLGGSDLDHQRMIYTMLTRATDTLAFEKAQVNRYY